MKQNQKKAVKKKSKASVKKELTPEEKKAAEKKKLADEKARKEAEKKKLAEKATRRWPLDALLIIHRSGLMHPGDPIVLVAAASRHRRDSFAAAEFAMDHLKSESWFWKRERAGGEWRWIEPREVDFEALQRWG